MLCLKIEDSVFQFAHKERPDASVGRYVLVLLYDKDSFQFIKGFYKKYGISINNSGPYDIYALFNQELKEILDEENLRKEKGLDYDFQYSIYEKETCFNEMLRLGKRFYNTYPRNSDEYKHPTNPNKEVFCFPAYVLYDNETKKYKVFDLNFIDIKNYEFLSVFVRVYKEICEVISKKYNCDFKDICDDIKTRMKRIKDLGLFEQKIQEFKNSNENNKKEKLIKYLKDRKGVDSAGNKLSWTKLAQEVGYADRNGLIAMINQGKNLNREKLEKLYKALDLKKDEIEKVDKILTH